VIFLRKPPQASFVTKFPGRFALQRGSLWVVMTTPQRTALQDHPLSCPAPCLAHLPCKRQSQSVCQLRQLP
jgi:hypothetical protein